MLLVEEAMEWASDEERATYSWLDADAPAQDVADNAAGEGDGWPTPEREGGRAQDTWLQKTSLQATDAPANKKNDDEQESHYEDHDTDEHVEPWEVFSPADLANMDMLDYMPDDERLWFMEGVAPWQYHMTVEEIEGEQCRSNDSEYEDLAMFEDHYPHRWAGYDDGLTHDGRSSTLRQDTGELEAFAPFAD